MYVWFSKNTKKNDKIKNKNENKKIRFKINKLFYILFKIYLI